MSREKPEKNPLHFRIKSALKSLENPLYLSKSAPWLYWKIYHFSWSSFYTLFNNPISKASLLASAVGYLIYLNDLLTKEFGFTFVTAGTKSALGMDLRDKLHFIYFGLLFIAIARIVFLWRRPHSIEFGPSLSNWVNYGLTNFTYYDFREMHGQIQREGHRTIYGKYYTDDWDAFVDDAYWSESGKGNPMDTKAKRESRQHVGFAQAKQTHEDLLRSILIDRYAEYCAKRKISLAVAVLLATFGYFLFLLPSADLTFTIIKSFFAAS